MKYSRSKVPIIQPDAVLRPVVGWEGVYAVTEDGRVWSIPRTVLDVLGRPRHIRGRWMTPTIDSRGYPMVSFRRPGEKILVRVHRLVAAAWLPPAKPGQVEVNHKDRDRTNAAASNLEWCTPTENQLHGWIGREATPRHRAAASRMGLSRRKLTDEQASAIRARIAAGEKKAALAREYEISERVIYDIGSGRRYSSLNANQQRAA